MTGRATGDPTGNAVGPAAGPVADPDPSGQAIDAHHHLWHPARGDYGWMPEGGLLPRPHLPAELAPQLAACGVGRTVLVQAAPTLAETHYLLGLADATDWVAGVVGWVDFADTAHRAALDGLAAHPKLVGLRPMVQDIAEDGWVTGAALDWAFDAMTEAGLTFDALGLPRHARPFLDRLSRHPDLVAVLDHGLKPDLAGGDLTVWHEDMRRLAEGTGAWVKLSGLATEAAPPADPARATAADVAHATAPAVERLLGLFGPARTIWGSDWPVCRLACDYRAWWDAARALTDHLAPAERAAIFGGNAATAYRLR